MWKYGSWAPTGRSGVALEAPDIPSELSTDETHLSHLCPTSSPVVQEALTAITACPGSRTELPYPPLHSWRWMNRRVDVNVDML